MIQWIEEKFGRKADVAAANIAAYKSGYNFGFTTEAMKTTYEVLPAQLSPGTYTNITGNTALAWGLWQGAANLTAPAVLRLLPDHPGFRHPPRAVEAQELGCAPSRSKTRSPPSGPPSVLPSSAIWRRWEPAARAWR